MRSSFPRLLTPLPSPHRSPTNTQDVRKLYLLKDDDWRWDAMPEIWEGKNVVRDLAFVCISWLCVREGGSHTCMDAMHDDRPPLHPPPFSSLLLLPPSY